MKTRIALFHAFKLCIVNRITFFITIFLIAYSTLFSQENNYSLEGNWLVQYDGLVQEGRLFNAFLSVYKPIEWYCDPAENGKCLYKWRYRSGSTYSIKGRYGDHFESIYNPIAFENNPQKKVQASSMIFRYNNNWYRTNSLIEYGHQDVRLGTWNHKDRKGNETWIRSKANISEVSFNTEESRVENEKRFGLYYPKKTKLTYSKMSWPPEWNLRANRPYFYINLYGTNLWGNHQAEFTGNSYDLQISEIRQIKDDSKEWPGSIIGLTLKVVIWPKVVPGEKTFSFDGQEIKFNMEVENFPDQTVYEEIQLPELPADGVIEDKGMIEGNKHYDLEKCNCDNISLARATYRKYKGMVGNWVWGDTFGGEAYRRDFDTKIVFERTKIFKPDKPTKFAFPEEITYESMMCFYFTFPESLAVMQDEDQNHICPVLVKVTYPYSFSREGVSETTYRLYNYTGSGGLGKIGTRNRVCIPVIVKNARIMKGDGKIEWSVNKGICGSVSFEIK